MRPGDDVLAHPEQGREVHSQTPTGVQGKGRSVIEMKPPKFQKPSRHTASFTSVDGLEYSFRTHDTKGKAMPYLQTMVLYLALIEQAKGGSVSTVFQAFKVKIEDMDGNPYFPIPDEVIEELGLKKPFVIEEDVEEIDPGFSLGD